MWFVWGLLASLFAAILAESNRNYKLDARLLNAWRSTFGAGIIAFAYPLMVWPSFSSAKTFYLVGGLDGIVTAIGMVLFFMLAARKTGRVTSMMMPVAAIGAYGTWCLLSPLSQPSIDARPVQFLIAAFSLFIICLSLQKIRSNDNSWESFLIVLPVGIAFGITDALTKWVLVGSHGIYPLAIAYTFLSICVCAATAWGAAFFRGGGNLKMPMISRKLLWCGFWCGFWTAGMYLCLTFSLTLSPNPTYPGIIMAMTPIWLYLLNQFRHTNDDASPLACVVMMAGAVGLWLSTL